MHVATRALSLDWIACEQINDEDKRVTLADDDSQPPTPTAPFSRHSFAKQLQQACMHAQNRYKSSDGIPWNPIRSKVTPLPSICTHAFDISS